MDNLTYYFIKWEEKSKFRMLNILSDIMNLNIESLTVEQKNLLKGPSEVYKRLTFYFTFLSKFCYLV